MESSACHQIKGQIIQQRGNDGQRVRIYVSSNDGVRTVVRDDDHLRELEEAEVQLARAAQRAAAARGSIAPYPRVALRPDPSAPGGTSGVLLNPAGQVLPGPGPVRSRFGVLPPDIYNSYIRPRVQQRIALSRNMAADTDEEKGIRRPGRFDSVACNCDPQTGELRSMVVVCDADIAHLMVIPHAGEMLAWISGRTAPSNPPPMSISRHQSMRKAVREVREELIRIGYVGRRYRRAILPVQNRPGLFVLGIVMGGYPFESPSLPVVVNPVNSDLLFPGEEGGAEAVNYHILDQHSEPGPSPYTPKRNPNNEVARGYPNIAEDSIKAVYAVQYFSQPANCILVASARSRLSHRYSSDKADDDPSKDRNGRLQMHLDVINTDTNSVIRELAPLRINLDRYIAAVAVDPVTNRVYVMVTDQDEVQPTAKLVIYSGAQWRDVRTFTVPIPNTPPNVPEHDDSAYNLVRHLAVRNGYLAATQDWGSVFLLRDDAGPDRPPRRVGYYEVVGDMRGVQMISNRGEFVVSQHDSLEFFLNTQLELENIRSELSV